MTNRSNQQIKRDARVDFLVSSAVVVVGIVIVLVTFPNLVATLMNTPVEFYPDLSIAAVKKVPLVVDPKPHDCEFNAVPYGAKYCHYEKFEKKSTTTAPTLRLARTDSLCTSTFRSAKSTTEV